jgi:putative chitinase
MITDNQLAALFPLSTAENRAKYLGPLNSAFVRYGIDTPPVLRAFLAIIGVETGQLRVVTENLNYSAVGLRNIFGKYFPTAELANQYACRPEKIANRVYGGRMGNGPESSGDGWKYRGRGLIQLTGKDNYTQASNGMYALPMGVDFVAEPDLIATPEYAAQSAAWFF